MDTPPKVPLSYGARPVRLSNLTLPAGENALRSAGGLMFLTTAADAQGRHREVIVQQVAERWYIRTSVSDDPNEAPVFRLEEDGSVSGYGQVPPGVPQVSAIVTGTNSTSATNSTRDTNSTKASPPVPSTGEVFVEYAGRKGTIVTRADGTYLRLDGDPDPIELESVRGSKTLFTPRGREDVLVRVDRNGQMTVSDSSGQPAGLRGGAAVRVPASPPPSPPTVRTADSATGETAIEYQGIKGRISARSDGSGLYYLSLDGEPGTVELESVRGSKTLFTPRGRDDVFVNAGQQGKLTVTDSRGVPVRLKEMGTAKEPGLRETNATPGAVPGTSVPAAAYNEPAGITPAYSGAAYNGPGTGTLTCSGDPIPQNGEYVFSQLPAAKLELVYDSGIWEARTVGPVETQRVIIRNKKPGAQKKCTIHWKVVP